MSSLPQYYDDQYNSSQLAIAFSYDNGTNWTRPTPVNTSSFSVDGTSGATWCRRARATPT